ncbi:hypothetical protein CFOL_v3_16006, partial [Cephalotus follicularis]
NIFRTRFLCGGKVCNVIFDGGSAENIIARDAFEKLKLPTEKHPILIKLVGFEREMKFWLHLDAWLNLLWVIILKMRPCVTLCPWMLVMFYWEGRGCMTMTRSITLSLILIPSRELKKIIPCILLRKKLVNLTMRAVLMVSLLTRLLLESLNLRVKRSELCMLWLVTLCRKISLWSLINIL